jgi:protein ImuB
MAFACIYIPDFLVQSVVRAGPALRDNAAPLKPSVPLVSLAPLALIGGSPPLWSVVAASPAALEAGIQLGMTKAQAAEFIGVQICPRSQSQEKAAHAALLDVAWSVSPRVEDTAPDAIVLDLDGLTSLFGSDENIAQELARRAPSVGLIPQIAVASNIEAAILAARGFPEITIIPRGEEGRRLGNLSVAVLVTSTEILEILGRWGVHTLQALAALPVLQLSERLGQEGVRLHELARGACQRALILAQPASSFEEEMVLDDAVEELEPLSFLLGRLLDQLCARLEARALAVRAVHVRFALALSFEKDFQTLTEGTKKPSAKSYAKVLRLPVPLRNPKTLLKLLRLQLQADPPPAPIQKISLRADSAAPRLAQNGLFWPSAPDPEKLELTLARLAKLVGESNIGSPELLDSHRPDPFRMARFLVPEEGKKNRRTQNAATKESGYRLTGFRIFRSSLPIKVELHEKQPARVCVHGVYGQVITASGPWRSSGDWWQEDAWQQDEWDLGIEFRPSRRQREHHGLSAAPDYGVYRIYYDALREGWFARGYYD